MGMVWWQSGWIQGSLAKFGVAESEFVVLSPCSVTEGLDNVSPETGWTTKVYELGQQMP